jgi:hypothetical protein
MVDDLRQSWQITEINGGYVSTWLNDITIWKDSLISQRDQLLVMNSSFSNLFGGLCNHRNIEPVS